MINHAHKPRSCQLFLVNDSLVVRRDDFLSNGLRVGNTEDVEILSLASSQDNVEVGEAILRALSQVEVIASLPERRSDYVPPYILATGFHKFEEFEALCCSCGCIESQNSILLFPAIYEPIRKGFRHDRSNQILSVLDPATIGRNAMMLLV